MSVWYQQQLMEEHEQALEEALIRAEKNEATESDWETIYAECGLNRRSDNESYRQSKQ